MNDSQIKTIVASIGITVSIAGYFLRDFFGGGGAGHLANLAKVVCHNPGFWIVIAIAAVFGLYRKLSKPEEFLWRELPIQLAASTFVILGLYMLFFTTSTDLVDTEVWNGHVTRAEYHEGWTQKITVKVKDSTSTTYVRHPPYWHVKSTAGDFDTSSNVYDAFRRKFGGEKKEFVFHANQSSIGDGNMYYISCDRNAADTIPASRPHSYVNYLRASDSIRKLRGNIDAFKTLLKQYPTVRDSTFGEIEFDRVIVSGANVPAGWVMSVDTKLDTILKTLSPRKKVNVVVYVVGTADRKFASALREYWVQGKKNDVAVVVGATEFPKVDWAEVIAWTKVEEFPIALRNDIGSLESLTDSGKFVETIVSHVSKPKSQGGYERSPMSDYEYLLADISLPIWCQAIIVILGGITSWFTSVWLINNEWRIWKPSAWTGGLSRRVRL